MAYTVILISLLVLNILILFLSWKSINNSGKKITFLIKWGFLAGIFTWEDACVICTYNTIIIILTLLVGDIRWLILGFLVFWLIRGLGETIYYFLQQFFPKKQFPHDSILKFTFWNKIFGKISEQKFYILTQVSVQMVTALSLFFIILLLKYWEEIELYKWL